MITDNMNWIIVVVTGRVTEPLKAIGPFALEREAIGHGDFIGKPYNVFNLADKNQYGAPAAYPFLTESEVG